MATFDLYGTVPGDPRYDQADAALRFHGQMFRPVKQLRFVITRSTCKAVKASIEQRLGRQATVLVVPLKSIPAWKIFSAKKQREWRRFIRALQENGVEILYVTRDVENGL
jgi:hypothetical protein